MKFFINLSENSPWKKFLGVVELAKKDYSRLIDITELNIMHSKGYSQTANSKMQRHLNIYVHIKPSQVGVQ